MFHDAPALSRRSNSPVGSSARTMRGRQRIPPGLIGRTLCPSVPSPLESWSGKPATIAPFHEADQGQKGSAPPIGSGLFRGWPR